MVSYKQLTAFISVAQSSTFAEAADKVHLSQPALSSSIKKLESQLGGLLFSRSTRKVQLSHEGAEFLPVAIRLINDWDSAIGDMQNLFAMQRGKLTIAAMPSFANTLLPAILNRFAKQWSGVNLCVLDVVMEAVIQSVLEGRAELGFTFEADQLSGLEFFPLMTDKFVVVTSADHSLSKVESVTWQQLANVNFVAMNRGSTVRRWIDEYTMANHIQLRIVAEANQLSTLGEFVRHGMGVSIVPGICESQFTSNGLHCIALKNGGFERNIGIIKTSRKSLSVPAQALWDSVVI